MSDKLIGTLTKHVETNVAAVLEKKRRQQQQKAAAAAQDRNSAASVAATQPGVSQLNHRMRCGDTKCSRRISC